jgi:hypothetical protein
MKPSTAPATLGPHPLAMIVIYCCCFAILTWAAYQVRHRCRSCGAVPVRCHCS